MLHTLSHYASWIGFTPHGWPKDKSLFELKCLVERYIYELDVQKCCPSDEGGNIFTTRPQSYNVVNQTTYSISNTQEECKFFA